MKVKKKTAMLASFMLGTLLLATTALADISSKSGYEQLKDSIKVTAEQLSDNFNNFTMDVSFVLKDNGQILISDNEVRKFDRAKNAEENISYRESVQTGKHDSYFYNDKTTSIRRETGDETYYVTEFTGERSLNAFGNPFKEKEAEDVERIVDAVVGSLKEHVVVKENPDGSKELSGSLSEVQIPPLVNAVASFQLKREFNGRSEQMPHLTDDIFVKEVNGRALINKDGVLESILGIAVLSGKDAQGEVHEVTVEVLVKLTGINSTTVVKPDLSGKKVVKNIAQQTKFGPEISNPQKFVGTFKNDIVIEKEGKYVKIGERILEIEEMDNKTVSGRYHEEYKPGFEAYAGSARDFKFEARFNKDVHSAEFDYVTESGSKLRGNINFDELLGRVYFNIDRFVSTPGYDSIFRPVLE